MKRLLFLTFIFTFLFGCTNEKNNKNKNNNESIDEYMAELRVYEMEKKRRDSIFNSMLADSVSLSFNGINLGRDFKKEINKALSEERLFKSKYFESNTYASRIATIKGYIPVVIKVYDFNNKISNIIISFDDYDNKNEIKKIYKNKYGDYYKEELPFSLEKYIDLGNTIDNTFSQISYSIGNTIIWEFGNQSISITEKVKLVEEVKTDRNKSTERNPQGYFIAENKYYDGTVIIYSDKTLSNMKYNKEQEKKAKEQEKKAKEQREKFVKDSIQKAAYIQKASEQDI